MNTAEEETVHNATLKTLFVTDNDILFLVHQDNVGQIRNMS